MKDLLIEQIPSQLQAVMVERKKLLFMHMGRDVHVSLKSNFLVIDRIQKDVNVAKAASRKLQVTPGAGATYLSSKATIINLDGVAILDVSDRMGRNTFSVSYVNQAGKVKTVFLTCGSASVLEAWLLALRNVAGAPVVFASDFDVLYIVGKGHFGRVSLVEHKDTGAILALKEVKEEKYVAPKKKSKRSKKTSAAEMRVQKQISERLILAKVSQSSFFSRLAYAFRENGKLYFASEFSARGDLYNMIRKVQRVDIATARFIVSELVEGIAFLHGEGIVHRDIKLENLMLDSDGHLKIIDLGLSKQLAKRETRNRRFGFSFSMCGTSYYMSPEMIKGVGHSLVSDWWQVGTLLYELLVGKPAFTGKTQRAIHDRVLSGTPADYGVVSKIAEGKESPEDVKLVINLLEALLVNEPGDRLGRQGPAAVKNHPFFRTVDWKKVHDREQELPEMIRSYVFGLTSSNESHKNIITESVIATYFRDAKTRSGVLLNKDQPPPTIEDLDRQKQLRGTDNSSESTTVRSASNYSSSSDATSQSSSRTIPIKPKHSETLGPFMGFAFVAGKDSMSSIRSHDYVVYRN